jgi:hypothetical protein
MKSFSIKSTTILATIALTSFTAQAQSKQPHSISKHEIGIGISAGEAVLANVRYGYNVNENFRFEVEASTGTVISNGSDFIFSDDDINYWISGFGVARLPYGNNNSAFFVRGGVGASEATAPAFTSQTPIFGPDNTSYPDLTANGTVFQIGLGVEHFFTKGFGVRAEGIYANDSSFDEITDTVGRQPRDSTYTLLGASIVFRF